MTVDQSYAEAIPEDDQEFLKSQFVQSTRLPYLNDKGSGELISMFSERIDRETFPNSRGLIDLAKVRQEYVHWIRNERHHLLRNVFREQLTEQLHATVHPLILREAANRAAMLFNDWNGETYPPFRSNDKRLLVSTLWTHVPPRIPPNAHSVIINTQGLASEDLFVIAKHRNFTFDTMPVMRARLPDESSRESFMYELWQDCLLSGVCHNDGRLTFE
jgi:hypothetical protein